MDRWESLVDRKIREAMEEGEFDDLHGKGQPIDLSENPFENPDVRTAHRLLRNAGFGPAWLEEQKDIDARLEIARKTLSRAQVLYGKTGSLSQSAQWQRAAREFRHVVDELNQRIRLYNLKAPSVVFHRKTIDADREIRELEQKEV